jgi:hypothetical protein
MPNVNVTCAEMQAAARQLQAGEQTIEGDLTRLKQLVDNLVTGGSGRWAGFTGMSSLRRIRRRTCSLDGLSPRLAVPAQVCPARTWCPSTTQTG